MITPRIQALFDFIDYLDANKATFFVSNEYRSKLEQLSIEIGEAKHTENYKEKKKRDTLMKEYSEKRKPIQDNIITPIVKKSLELGLCTQDNYGADWNLDDGETMVFTRSFDEEDLPVIREAIKKYKQYNESNTPAFLGSFFPIHMDKAMSVLIDFFSDDSENETWIKETPNREELYKERVNAQVDFYKGVFEYEYEQSEAKSELLNTELKNLENLFNNSTHYSIPVTIPRRGIMNLVLFHKDNSKPIRLNTPIQYERLNLEPNKLKEMRNVYERIIVRGNKDYSRTHANINPTDDMVYIEVEGLYLYWNWLKSKANSQAINELQNPKQNPSIDYFSLPSDYNQNDDWETQKRKCKQHNSNIYRRYETNIENGEKTLNKLLKTLLDATKTPLSITEYEKLERQFNQIKSISVRALRESMDKGCKIEGIENVAIKRIFDEMIAFYEKSVPEIDQHLKTLEGLKKRDAENEKHATNKAIVEQKEEAKKRKYIAKEYALAYILDQFAAGKQIPTNPIEGSFNKKEIERIGIAEYQQNGDTFYRAVKYVISYDLNKLSQLETISQDWLNAVTTLSKNQTALLKYLTDKNLNGE